MQILFKLREARIDGGTRTIKRPGDKHKTANPDVGTLSRKTVFTLGDMQYVDHWVRHAHGATS